MIRRAAVAALLMVVVATGSALAATKMVDATSSNTFNPVTSLAALGDTVQWSNPSTRNHTSSADLFNLWSFNLPRGGPSQSFAFKHAGLYAYHCDIHGTMTGRVRVKLRFTRNSNGSITVRMATENPATGFRHELQRKNPGGSFGATMSFTTQVYTFTPTVDGTYQFRARYRKVGGVATGWSPILSIAVT
jgi:plastocyanin